MYADTLLEVIGRLFFDNAPKTAGRVVVWLELGGTSSIPNDYKLSLKSIRSPIMHQGISAGGRFSLPLLSLQVTHTFSYLYTCVCSSLSSVRNGRNYVRMKKYETEELLLKMWTGKKDGSQSTSSWLLRAVNEKESNWRNEARGLGPRRKSIYT